MNGFVYMEFYDVTWVVYYGFFITDVPWWIRYLDFTVPIPWEATWQTETADFVGRLCHVGRVPWKPRSADGRCVFFFVSRKTKNENQHSIGKCPGLWMMNSD